MNERKSSPIEPLLMSMASSPYGLAPERQEDLKNLVDEHGIELVFDNNDSTTTLLVKHDSNEIWFGVALAERLWAYSFAYVILLDRIKDLRPGDSYDWNADEDSRRARELLIWAHQGQTEGAESTWPEGLPHPVSEPTEDFGVFAATEAFLCMVGWAFLHEIAHVVLDHKSRNPTTSEDFEQLEYEADDWASEWILQRWRDYSSDEDVYVKRTLGATFMLSIIASFEAYRRTYGKFRHPDPPERLLHFLDRFAPEVDTPTPTKEHYSWAAASIIVSLHLENAGKKPVISDFGTFRKYLLAATNAM